MCFLFFKKPYHLLPAHSTSLWRCHLFVSFLSRFSVCTVFIRSSALCAKFKMEEQCKKVLFSSIKLYLKPCSWTFKSCSASPMRCMILTAHLTMFRSVIHLACSWNLMTRPGCCYWYYSPRNSLRQSAIAEAFAEVKSVSLYSLRQHNCRSENLILTKHMWRGKGRDEIGCHNFYYFNINRVH